MNIEQAAQIAAQWWTERIAEGFEGSAGDAWGDAHFSIVRSQLSPVTGAQLELFRIELERAIIALCSRPGSWREDEPNWGSGLRCVGSDYGPDATLEKAFKAAGISVLHCPRKTLSWINPDGVTVQSGYRAGILKLE